jgi:hypothetical protein
VSPHETPSSPQARKFGLGPGRRVWLESPPAGWAFRGAPPGLVDVEADGPADIIVGFFTEARTLEARLPELATRIFPAGMLWVAWPRRAAGHTSDITDTVVRELVLPLGLVDTKVAALDEDWSALRVVWRRELRSAP